ncbi:hypothetical protein B0H11DRAFT_2249377 [Mycena galericulata]|nr:hypothetical protein B0H11DRAFT_2249377 [Mycena galericulata]
MPNPGHLALVVGLASSSYFTFGNIGCAYFGVMPATARRQTSLPVVERLALWDHFLRDWQGKLTPSVVSAVSLSVAAYFTPALRNILAAGAAAAFTVGPYTLLLMMPVNNALGAQLRSTKLKPMEPAEEARVLDQLDSWRAMHRVRIVLGVISWLSVTSAILASGPFIQL